MIEAHSYTEICDQLARRFQNDYRRKDVNITGLIFANPESPFAQDNVIPEIDYWHHRSDNVTDFFCAGFGAMGPDDTPRDKCRIEGIRNDDWWYSAEYFTRLVLDIESRSTWRHSGGCDLIITNARFAPEKQAASLDFKSALSINLDAAVSDTALHDVSNLMIMMFEFAKHLNEDSTDPAWELSDKLGLRVVKKSLFKLLLEWLPKWLSEPATQAVHFACVDISPR